MKIYHGSPNPNLNEATNNPHRLMGLRRLKNPKFAKPHKAYVHFTDLRHARDIAKSRTLLATSYYAYGHVGAHRPYRRAGVYAIPVGARGEEAVQQEISGRPKNRRWAIVFTTRYRPDAARITEAIWYMSKLPIDRLKIVPAREAENLLHWGGMAKNPNYEVDDWFEGSIHGYARTPKKRDIDPRKVAARKQGLARRKAGGHFRPKKTPEEMRDLWASQIRRTQRDTLPDPRDTYESLVEGICPLC